MSMRRTLIAAMLATGSLAIVHTQTTPGQTSPAPASKTVTFTGCVAAGAQPGTFVLNNAMGDMKDSSSTMGTTPPSPSSTSPSTPGTTGTSGHAMTDKSYRLMAGSGVDLSPHVGHKVQVVGTISGSESSSSSTTSTSAATTQPGNPPSTPPSSSTSSTTSSTSTMGSEPTKSMDVRSVTMLSSTCQ
jgi:hypothetical protein